MPKKIIVAEGDVVTGAVRFVFEDETTQELNVKSLSPEMQLRLAIHGLSQKAGDSYAGAAKEATPVQFAKDSVAEVFKQLVAGDWRVASSSGPRVTDLATAYSIASGETLEAAVELISSLDEKQEKELRKRPKVALQLALIAKARQDAKLEALTKAAAAEDAKAA